MYQIKLRLLKSIQIRYLQKTGQRNQDCRLKNKPYFQICLAAQAYVLWIGFHQKQRGAYPRQHVYTCPRLSVCINPRIDHQSHTVRVQSAHCLIQARRSQRINNSITEGFCIQEKGKEIQSKQINVPARMKNSGLRNQATFIIHDRREEGRGSREQEREERQRGEHLSAQAGVVTLDPLSLIKCVCGSVFIYVCLHHAAYRCVSAPVCLFVCTV